MTQPRSEPWRELALRHLPDLASLISEAESDVDLWWSLKELLADCGVDEAQKPIAASVYAFAWWCVAESGELRLKAEVEAYFYEDLPVYSDFKDQLPIHISPSQFEQLAEAFSCRLTDDEFGAFRAHYFAEQAGRP